MTAKLATSEQVAELQGKVAALRLTKQAAALTKQIERHEMASANLTEGWGDFINPLDAFSGEMDYFGGGNSLGGMPGGPSISRPSDRADGDNAPFFDNEQRLAIIRGASEWIAQADTTAIGALQALTSYVVGTNGQYDAAAKEDVAGAEEAEAAVQEVIDDFLRRVHWCNSLDRETFRRWRRAGEVFKRVVELPGGYAKLEIWEPAWITEPQYARQVEQFYGLPELDWKYGVVTTKGDATEIWGYFGLRNGDPQKGEFIPATEMQHMKCNVDSNVKRGLSDFWPGQQWFEKAAKLLDRVLDGGAIQASIALVRKYAPNFRRTQIQGAADGLVEFDSIVPDYGTGGTRAIPTERFYSGKVVDRQGVELEPGPLGQSNAPTYLEIEEAGVTKAMRCWQMHKALATGDASADTYASALVAESPFTKVCESMQGEDEYDSEQMLWKVVDIACMSDPPRLPYEPQQLRTLIDITCKLPDIAVRNKLEEHTIREGENKAGVLSIETWCEEVGRSFEKEQERGATPAMQAQAEADAEAMKAAGAASGGGYQRGGARQAALAEAVREAKTLREARALVEAA